jgi:hypothetical protein
MTKTTKKSKYATVVTEAERNEGIHGTRQLKQAQDLLLSQPYKSPVLFHFVLTGSDSISVYQKTINAIARKLRTHECLCEYFGAYELDNEDETDGKGLHAHCYFLIETATVLPYGILNIKDGSWLHKLTTKNKLNRIHIAKPKNAVHRPLGSNPLYARPTLQRGRLADCCDWISYAYKTRSKEGVPSREKYFNSEFKGKLKANTLH